MKHRNEAREGHMRRGASVVMDMNPVSETVDVNTDANDVVAHPGTGQTARRIKSYRTTCRSNYLEPARLVLVVGFDDNRPNVPFQMHLVDTRLYIPSPR